MQETKFISHLDTFHYLDFSSSYLAVFSMVEILTICRLELRPSNFGSAKWSHPAPLLMTDVASFPRHTHDRISIRSAMDEGLLQLPSSDDEKIYVTTPDMKYTTPNMLWLFHIFWSIKYLTKTTQLVLLNNCTNYDTNVQKYGGKNCKNFWCYF